MMSIMPFVGIALFLTQLQSFHVHFSIIALQDLSAGFEEAHHAVASVLGGAIAGVSAGIIMDNVSSNPPDLTIPPDSPAVPQSPRDTPPQETTPGGTSKH